MNMHTRQLTKLRAAGVKASNTRGSTCLPRCLSGPDENDQTIT